MFGGAIANEPTVELRPRTSSLARALEGQDQTSDVVHVPLFFPNLKGSQQEDAVMTVKILSESNEGTGTLEDEEAEGESRGMTRSHCQGCHPNSCHEATTSSFSFCLSYLS